MGYKETWRLRARKYLAAAFGGKCTVCGYDKTIAALDYHHIDPNSKDFHLAYAMTHGHSWAKIVEEARKCTIVCCRCHRELHAGITELPKNYAKFNEEYVDVIKLKQKEFDKCPICNSEKNKNQKYCSKTCFDTKQKKFTIEKEILQNLVQLNSYESIGRSYGVTGAAIKKRCNKLGIILERRKK